MNRSGNSMLYLVDGTSQLFRAYFALPGLTNSEGLPTNAVYGFTTMLQKLLKEEQPRHLAVAFDLPGPTFRHDKYAEYKANRPPTPDDLNRQVPYAKQVCQAFHIPILELAGYEADDLIATHVRQGREAGYDVTVVASDKDLLQLVGEGVTVLNPVKNLTLDPAGVEQSFGVPPERVVDVQGLMGDSVDNIPGVPGVGGKTALQMVRTYGGIEDALARAGRFVAVYDCRDTVLTTLDTLQGEDAVASSTLTSFADAIRALSAAVVDLRDNEADPEFAERLSGAARLLERQQLAGLEDRAGEKGRAVAKEFRELKKEIKALDKGSSRRAWYSMHEHADQARLSRELALLDPDVPVEFDAKALVVGEPDREQLRALFTDLDFSRLLVDLDAGDDVATTDTSAAIAHQILSSREDLDGFVRACAGAETLALYALAEPPGDGVAGRLVGLALSAGDAGCAYVPLAHEFLGAPEQSGVDDLAAALGPLLADSATAKVAEDLQLHQHLLARAGVPVSGWDLDVAVAAFMLNPGRSSYPLEQQAREFLGREIAPLESLTGTGAKRVAAHQIEVEKVAAAAAERVDVIHRLRDPLRERLADAELLKLYETVDGPVLPLLAQMEHHGIRVEVATLETMSKQMEGELDRLRGEIHTAADVEFNVDSPKQLREVLFDKLGLKTRRKTAKSKVSSTDARVLEELAEEAPIARTILEYRELAKLKGTYVDRLPTLVNPRTGRIHTRFHPTGAATGRLSSSDPNLQNIPVRTAAGREIRSAFVADDGHVFLAADYSQVELRILAHLTQAPGLIEAFRQGEDIHRHTAAQVFGVLPDLVSDTMRRQAKAVNFGLLYGMSERRLAAEQGMKLKDARQFVQAYFERFAGVRDYIDRIRAEAERDGAVRTLLGRVRYFPQLHQRVNRGIHEQALRAAVNTTVQGTAADLMKMAMLRVADALQEADLAARILLQVHDELLLEVPEGELEPTREATCRAMEQVFPLAVPLVVEARVGTNWKDVA